MQVVDKRFEQMKARPVTPLLRHFSAVFSFDQCTAELFNTPLAEAGRKQGGKQNKKEAGSQPPEGNKASGASADNKLSTKNAQGTRTLLYVNSQV